MTSEIGISLIGKEIPIICAINEEMLGIKLLGYSDILKSKLFSDAAYIKLPEDFVELEQEKIEEEKEIKNNTTIKENKLPYEIKSVTFNYKDKFRNNTKYKIDVNKLINEKLKFKLNSKETDVIIYHTHTTESYTKEKTDKYKESGNFRTLDKRFSVVNVGERIKQVLERNKLKVYHEQEFYDYPSYNLSYSKAGKAISQIVKKYKGADIVLDIHRDAIGNEKQVYRPIVNIKGKEVAQILLVVGTNQGGLKHDKWRENLKFALQLQKVANEKYPGLCRYVILRKERFNQQVAPGAILVEMGATGNTMKEVLLAADLFSEVLIETIK